MAPMAATLDLFTRFAPFGYTPAVNLVQDLPPETEARILQLGCGDPKTVLFTAHLDSHNSRPLHFTACDAIPEIIARNVILYTLALEDLDKTQQASLWNLFHHNHVSEVDLSLLHTHTKELAEMASSASQWQSGKYAETISFFDDSTRSKVQAVLQWYSTKSSSGHDAKALRDRLDAMLRHENHVQTVLSRGTARTYDSRCTWPADFGNSQKDLKALREQYERCGSWLFDDQEKAKHPNPLLLSANEVRFHLDWSRLPLIGFHMATKYVSRPHAKSSEDADLEGFVAEAKDQFHAWMSSFRQCASRTTVQFSVSDPLTFCESYPGKADKSRLFNVIDTSNLIDYYGSINLLVFATPLLERSPASVMYTDVLRRDRPIIETVCGLLCGHFQTVSLLLGLQLIDTWTNLSVVAPLDESHAVTMRRDKMDPRNIGQYYCRLRWRTLEADHCSLQANSVSMCMLVCAVHDNMLAQDDYHRHVAIYNSNPRTDMDPLHSKVPTVKTCRGTFAAFVAYLMPRHDTEWKNIIESILIGLELVNNRSIAPFQAELYSELYLRCGYACESLRNFSSPEWPLITYVTLKVPRAKLKLFEDMSSEPEKLQTPFIQAVISGDPATNTFQHRFANLQTCFGTFQSSGDFGGDFEGFTDHITILPDARAWASNASMLVTFAVPTNMLLRGLSTKFVGIAVRQTPYELRLFQDKLGPGLKIYHTRLNNTSDVALSRVPPIFDVDIHLGLAALSLETSPWPRPGTSKPCDGVDPSLIFGLFDPIPALTLGISSQFVAETLTTRIVIEEGPALESLRSKCDIQFNQRDPFCLSASFLVEGSVHAITRRFPLLVAKDRSKLRIARKSGYLEIIAGISYDNEGGFEDDDVYVLCNQRHGLLRSIPHLSLDLQPSVLIDNDLGWMTHLLDLQMSVVDADQRARHAVCRPRQALKTGLETMFKSAMDHGLQKPVSFFVGVPGRDANFMVFLLSGFKFDLGTRTPVLDAAIFHVSIPLKPWAKVLMKELVDSNGERSITFSAASDAMNFWWKVIPFFAERCRQWPHKEGCSWQQEQRVPSADTWEPASDPLCGCGKGVFPEGYPMTLQGWDKIKPHGTRVAVSPMFFVPFIQYAPVVEVEAEEAQQEEPAEDFQPLKVDTGKWTGPVVLPPQEAPRVGP